MQEILIIISKLVEKLVKTSFSMLQSVSVLVKPSALHKCFLLMVSNQGPQKFFLQKTFTIITYSLVITFFKELVNKISKRPEIIMFSWMFQMKFSFFLNISITTSNKYMPSSFFLFKKFIKLLGVFMLFFYRFNFCAELTRKISISSKSFSLQTAFEIYLLLKAIR